MLKIIAIFFLLQNFMQIFFTNAWDASQKGAFNFSYLVVGGGGGFYLIFCTIFFFFFFPPIFWGRLSKMKKKKKNRGRVTSNGLFWPQKSTLLCLAVNFDIKHTIFYD